MRLFVSVDLPKEVKDELYRIQKQVLPKYAKVKWVSKKNLHLTLKFIGETKNGITDYVERLKRVKFKPFEVSLSEFNVFPNFERMNTLWVGVKPQEKVVGLQYKVDSELLGIVNNDQKFVPHLTLGRVKNVKREKEFVSIINSLSVNPIEFKIDSFNLALSKLTKDGPIYTSLETFKA